MSAIAPIDVDPHSFIWDKIGRPSTWAINFCLKLQVKAEKIGSGLSSQCSEMKAFSKTRSMHIVSLDV